MTLQIAVMAKAPVAGQAKTRLAPALGEAGAAALAARLLAHALAQAAAADLGRVTLWATPDLHHPAFQQAQAAHGLRLRLQPDADLGLRMAAAFEAARPPGCDTAAPLLLMGSDAPAIDAALLRQAAALLMQHDAVFVPAHDGGYALVGLRAATAAQLHALFDGMRWSTDQVMAQTRARLSQAGLRHAELPPVADIDEPADLQHLPAGWLPEAERTDAPGRSCPLHYRYGPGALAGAAAQPAQSLFIAGGLYGNEPALQELLALYAAEPGRPGIDKHLVFNGDFNWFNVDAAAFERLNTAVLQHTALRGNVETEIAATEAQTMSGEGADADAGCGCAYPAWVGDAVVERSNRILQRLRGTAAQFPALQQALAALPMWARFQVGAMRVAVVHGDAESLAGWGFAAEHLADAGHRRRLQHWFDQAEVDAFACSHTCLPVYRGLTVPGDEAGPAGGAAAAAAPLVLNNGATGMPNFRGDAAGLVTRIALTPWAGPAGTRRLGLRWGDVHVDALAVDSAGAAWREQFLHQWPAGSDAHASYWARIVHGPDWSPAQALPDVDPALL